VLNIQFISFFFISSSLLTSDRGTNYQPPRFLVFSSFLFPRFHYCSHLPVLTHPQSSYFLSEHEAGGFMLVSCLFCSPSLRKTETRPSAISVIFQKI
jgi:hypothetical protein